jgi:SWI/SNF-related matrix-associated actin-dependent regulator of chromatin subfamily A3
MGLGKTLQMISLILSRREDALEVSSDEDEPSTSSKTKSGYDIGFVPLTTKKLEVDENVGKFKSKGTLVICPLSLVYNWEQQIIDHSVPGSLKVLVYHGSQRSQNARSLLQYDVVITTYNVIGVNLDKGASALHQIYWNRIILDEAHNIKNVSTAQSKAAILFKATYRWCLTYC